MTKAGTIVKVMQAVLLVTILTPATVYADPLSTRQMLAQAEILSQDQAVKGEVKRIDRGLILGTAQAATNANGQRPLEMPAISAAAVTAPAPISAIEGPTIELAALPTAQVETIAPATVDTPTREPMQAPTSSIVTLPAPAQPATDTISPSITSVASTANVATTPTPVTPDAPVIAVQTSAPVTTPAATTTTNAHDTKADRATKVTATKTAIAKTSHQRRMQSGGDDSFNVAGVNISGGNIGGQLMNIINRPEVKAMLAHYGMN